MGHLLVPKMSLSFVRNLNDSDEISVLVIGIAHNFCNMATVSLTSVNELVEKTILVGLGDEEEENCGQRKLSSRVLIRQLILHFDLFEPSRLINELVIRSILNNSARLM